VFGSGSTPVSVDHNGDYTSGDYTTVAAGSYYWIASFSGDANNDPVTTACGDAGETSVVGPATPGITTTAVTPVTVGAMIHDTAHVTGLVNPTGAGTITFTLYSDPQCSSQVFTSGSTPASVTANGDYVSGDYTTVAAGSFYWIASFSGDVNNNPVTTACGDEGETSVVNPLSPNLTTNTTPDSGKVGMVTLKDSANLSGATSDAGGTINFYLFAPGVQCTASGSGAVYKSKGVPVSGNGVYHSIDGNEVGNNTATKAGTYHWLAVYSGDANNVGTNSGCGTEPVHIVAPPPAPPPVINPPVPVTG
jgi:hypothetical protein